MSEAALSPPTGRRQPPDSFEPVDLTEMTFMQTLRGVVRLTTFFGLVFICMPVQLLFVLTRVPWRRTFPWRFQQVACKVLGFRVKVTGEVAPGGGVLIAANHTSWIDIMTVSAAAPSSFIAKSEVKRWPVFGWMARLQRSVFVERNRRSKTAEQRNTIKDRLASGDTIVLFPEGTSSDGNRVLPFKSALMSAAEGKIKGRDGVERDIRVQPMSVAYTKLRGLPMNRDYRPFFAWYGDMLLVPHLWDAARLGKIDCEIIIHPPITIAEAGSRKALAAQCEAVVAAGLVRSLSGRG